MPLLSFVLDIDRDTVVNQLCTVVVPPLFAYIGLLCIMGDKIANQLLRRDTYGNKAIKIRMYGIVRTGIVGFLLLFIVAYFLIYRVWEMAFFFAFALLGYAWVKGYTYCVHLDYTYRHIRFCTPRKTLLIPFESVSKMCWETRRGAIAYTLVIYYNVNAKIYLSSSSFVGLTKLKSTYDTRKYKK